VMKDSFRYIEPKFRVNPNRRHGPPASRHFAGPVRVSPPSLEQGMNLAPSGRAALYFRHRGSLSGGS
jgi:hypothetical protein